MPYCVVRLNSSEANTIGLSGLDGSVRQKTSARPSDASHKCGASIPVILLEMLWLAIRIYWCVIKAGNSSFTKASNAVCALFSSSLLINGSTLF